MTQSDSPAAERTGLPAIPFLTTSFAYDFRLFLTLWPVWWLAGVEQFLVPAFLTWEMLLSLVRRRGVVRVDTPVLLAVCLALWWLAPISWIPYDDLDIYLKDTATIWSQVFVLLLFINEIRTESDWKQVVRGLTAFGIVIAVGNLIFLSGLWRGHMTSLAGHLLPESLTSSSAFFESISVRSFGVQTAPGFSPLRTTSLALQSSGLSMICLALIPFMAWRGFGPSRRTIAGVVGLLGLGAGLFFAQSRISYVALLLGIALYAAMTLRRHSDWSLQLALSGLIGAVALTFVGLFWTDLIRAIEVVFVEERPYSWLTRARIYRETLELLPVHWIAGWGTQVRIQGLSSVFSAGTHSSHLGMLFQHGVVGLAIYLGLWLSLWKRILHESKIARRLSNRHARIFWTMIAISMFCFNVREVADTWWWDQTINLSVWTLWGLILTTRFSNEGAPPETAALEPTEPTAEDLDETAAPTAPTSKSA